jgi:regulator of replication initiation timing
MAKIGFKANLCGNFHNKENHTKRPKKLIEPQTFPPGRIRIKEQIMENQTKNATIAEQTGAKPKYQSQPFNPKATLLLDVLPAEGVKPAANTPEKLLQGLLLNTEASAERTQFSKRKWQLVSLLTGMLLIAAVAIIGWLYLETSAAAMLRSRLEVENQSLREQTNLAGSQITELKSEMETLLNRNTELTTENAKLKSQNASPMASKPAATSKQSASKGATKEELVAAMGEPDRVYNTRGYEQLVYFGKKPGRFWLIDGHVVRVGG